ncbi:MAG: phytoene/squalene synthase family protein [Reyranellaceae bacterium]
MTAGELAASWAYCADQARMADHGRWLASLFAPEAARRDLWALLAFNAEIARTREVVREPMLGQIRLQWWREAIDEAYRGQVRAHQVMMPLADAIARRTPPRERFETLIDGRLRDLDDAPFESLAALEAYAAATSGSLSLLMLDLLGVGDGAREAAAAIGTAWALVGLASATPHLAARRRLMLPRDLMGAINPETLFTGQPDAALAEVVRAVVDRAAALLAQARRLRRQVPPLALPALVPARLLDRQIARIRRAGYRVFDLPPQPPSATTPIGLWWAVRTGRF